MDAAAAPKMPPPDAGADVEIPPPKGEGAEAGADVAPKTELTLVAVVPGAAEAPAPPNTDELLPNGLVKAVVVAVVVPPNTGWAGLLAAAPPNTGALAPVATAPKEGVAVAAEPPLPALNITGLLVFPALLDPPNRFVEVPLLAAGFA